ncbi:MAG: protein kinase [Gemmataceae bacterium]
MADFGLARLAAEPGVTTTGDVLGTLRYAAPEQAMAQHDLVDHRADVYSLGLTLYELLTLRPAVSGRDRQEVLRKSPSRSRPARGSWSPRCRWTWRRWCSRRWRRTREPLRHGEGAGRRFEVLAGRQAGAREAARTGAAPAALRGGTERSSRL